jgi:hypothetical protein
MLHPELIPAINKDFSLQLSEASNQDQLLIDVALYINHLIKNDFNKLLTLLYRIDVNENKLKNLLREKPNENAGELIAQLIIERQLQKIKTRWEFSQRDKNFTEEELL